MDEFFIAMLWGLCILAAFFGWGFVLRTLVRRALGMETGSSDMFPHWLEMPAYGIAVSAALGGILNLFSFASRMVLVFYVLAGMGLCLVHVIGWRRAMGKTRTSRKEEKRGPWLMLLAGVSILVVLRISSAVIAPLFPKVPG